jgi:hypothetical protein
MIADRYPPDTLLEERPPLPIDRGGSAPADRRPGPGSRSPRGAPAAAPGPVAPTPSGDPPGGRSAAYGDPRALPGPSAAAAPGSPRGTADSCENNCRFDNCRFDGLPPARGGAPGRGGAARARAPGPPTATHSASQPVANHIANRAR